MSRTAASIHKEADKRWQEFKKTLNLKKSEPWAPQLESQRKDLRRLYRALLFEHPFAPESNDAQTQLWMQTSYKVINLYKECISALDRVVHPDPRGDPASGAAQQHERGGNSAQATHGPVEYRKLLQRFRQFLAEEEKFWKALLARMHWQFSLTEADGAIARCEIGTPADEDKAGRPTRLAAGSPERERCVARFTKALVHLGDVARYKEQYNEAGGRPRAGHEEGPPAAPPRGSGRNRRGGGGSGAPDVGAIPRERNYIRAAQCYEQAQRLAPNDGNAAHQLAILASYRKDTFVALVQYYRALCVKQPYEPAAGNMATSLKKVKRDRPAVQTEGASQRIRVDALKENAVLLHALWQEGSVKRADQIAQRIAEEYKSLIHDGLLPDVTIPQIAILAQGALWRQRTQPASRPRRRGEDPAVAEKAAELAMLAHLLAVHQALWEVGTAHLGANDIAREELIAKRSPFVRILPTVRIASKWLLGNAKYLAQVVAQEDAADDGEEAAVMAGALRAFWQAFATFATALGAAYPRETLTVPFASLDEDRDMAGFLPLKLKKKTAGEVDNSAQALQNGHAGSGEPAQVERGGADQQKMRIADILRDALELSQAQDFPIANIGNPSFLPSPITSNVEEDAMTDSGRTDDDPVKDAFQKVIFDGSEDGGTEPPDEDDQDDQIVWNPRGASSPPRFTDAAEPRTPTAEHIGRGTNFVTGNGFSPTHRANGSFGKANLKPSVTALELIQGFNPTPRRPSVTEPFRARDASDPTTPKSTFLFQPNIWSTSADEPVSSLVGPSLDRDRRLSLSPPRQDIAQAFRSSLAATSPHFPPISGADLLFSNTSANTISRPAIPQAETRALPGLGAAHPVPASAQLSLIPDQVRSRQRQTNQGQRAVSSSANALAMALNGPLYETRSYAPPAPAAQAYAGAVSQFSPPPQLPLPFEYGQRAYEADAHMARFNAFQSTPVASRWPDNYG